MSLVQTALNLDDELMPFVAKGDYALYGLVKNVHNGQVVRHLDAYPVKGGNSNANVAVATAALLAIVTGISVAIVLKHNRKKVERFEECLMNYIAAVNENALSIEMIDELIYAMDKLKRRTRKMVAIKFSQEQLSALINCLCNHTTSLAKANHIPICNYEYSEEEKKDVLLKFRRNLDFQKQLFENAA